MTAESQLNISNSTILSNLFPHPTDGVNIYLLGPPRVESQGQSLNFDTSKALAMLAFLVMSPQAVSRDYLMTLLWPDAPEPKAKANLRRTLSSLKRGLNNRIVSADRTRIQAAFGNDDWCDVVALSSLIQSDLSQWSIDKLCAAAELFREDFLSGFRLRHNISFENWTLQHQVRLQDHYVALLEHITTRFTAKRQWPEAIKTARHLVEVDPFKESSHQILMRLYALDGQTAAALQQFHTLRETLDEQLGLAPNPKSQQLINDIREQRLDYELPAPELAPHNSPPTYEAAIMDARSTAPLGQEDAWLSFQESLRYFLNSADGQGITLLCYGQAGSGKSYFLASIDAYLKDKQIPALVIAGKDHRANDPWFPLTKTWQQAQSNNMARSALKLENLPHQFDENAAPQHWLKQIQSTAKHTPLVILIDDLPELSSDLQQWVKDLFTLTANYRLLVIVTLPSPGFQAYPLAALERSLWFLRQSGRLIPIHLKALGLQDIDFMAREVYSIEIPSPVAQQIHDWTSGHPALIAAYLHAYREHQNGRGAFSRLPSEVKAYCRLVASACSPACWQFLVAAAVVGERFGYSHLCSLFDDAEDQFVAGIDEALQRNLIQPTGERVEDPTIHYQFQNSIWQQFFYEEASRARQILYHRRLAYHLQAQRPRNQTDRAAHLGLIAHHFARAGHAHEAADIWIKGSSEAVRTFDYVRAARYIQNALRQDVLDPIPLHIRLAEAYAAQGNYAAADAHIGLADMSQHEGYRYEMFMQKGALLTLKGQTVAAAQAFIQAESFAHLSTLDPDVQIQHHLKLFKVFVIIENRNAADQHMGALEQLCTTRPDSMMAGAYRLADAVNLWCCQEIDAACESAADAYRIASRAGHESIEIRASALNILILGLGLTGQLAAARQKWQIAAALLALTGHRPREIALHNNIATLYQLNGRDKEAIFHVKQVVSGLKRMYGQTIDWQIAYPRPGEFTIL